MKYLLNSAVITKEGIYEYRLISNDEAKKWLEENEYESGIGYVETASAIEKLYKIPIPVSRSQVREFNVGDEALVFRLTIRLNDPSLKGKLTPDFIIKHCEVGILRRIK
jgi:hypothetical protein